MCPLVGDETESLIPFGQSGLGTIGVDELAPGDELFVYYSVGGHCVNGMIMKLTRAQGERPAGQQPSNVEVVSGVLADYRLLQGERSAGQQPSNVGVVSGVLADYRLQQKCRGSSRAKTA